MNHSLERHPRPPSSPPLPLSYLLAYAHTLTEHSTSRVLQRYGLTVRQFGLLMQLRAEPELTMAELARQLGITRQSIHGMASDLQRAGHLTKAEGASGRTRKLVLTPASAGLVTRIHHHLDRLEADFLAGVTSDDIEMLRHLLRRIIARATDDETWLS